MIEIISVSLLFFFSGIFANDNKAVVFKVMEETQVDTVIGNIAHYHSSFSKASYIIRSTFLKLSEKGDLMLRSRIDLDTICSQYEICCGEIECVIKATVIAKDKSSEQSETIIIHLSIFDKNDNWPIFSKPKQIIKVSENEPLGLQLYLEQAEDADVSLDNKIHHYIFKEPTLTFEIDQSRIPLINLIVRKPIDYETKTTYYATLEACDLAKQCNSQSLEIQVQDRNDNYPSFTKTNYEIEILENFPIGQEILKVEAKDLDSNLYNKILYGFNDVGDNNLRNTFIITENTGSIKLLRKLSTKVRQKYNFKVFAVDKEAISSPKALTNVLIKIKDLNDNTPIITPLIGDSKIEINETDSARELFTLQVTDKDIGINANVSCQLLQQYANDFRLDQVGTEIYSLSSTRPFDYETERQVKAVIECYDHGMPRNTVQKPFTVYIKDINEHPPHFVKDFQKLKLLENRTPDFLILQVNATDKDGSAILRYSFLGDANVYFTIDAETGQIRSGRRNLDRESIEKMEIHIIVTDALENPKTGQCSVIIEVLDENDNAPRFLDTPGVFNVTENIVIFSKVRGRVTATDEDKDEINNRIVFQIRRIFDSRKEILGKTIFRITEMGEIIILQTLDREENHNYTLEIQATDTGTPPNSAKMNFTILIQDENDNAPTWINPPFSNGNLQTLNISVNVPPGQAIMKFEAVDPDFGNNSRVSYTITNDSKYFFFLNQTTGELRVDRILPIGSLKLFLRAFDNGKPQKYSENSIQIFINGDEVATLNMSIIIVLIGITGFISIFLIIAIICVRRRPRYNNTDTLGSQNSFEPPKTTNLYSTGSWGQHPDETPYYPSGNFLSDNASVLYFPNEIESSVPMNTFVSKPNVQHPLISYQNIDVRLFCLRCFQIYVFKFIMVENRLNC